MAKEYIVKQGDNLWNISRREGVELTKIKQANPQLAVRQPPYGINPGDRLVIPEKPGQSDGQSTETKPAESKPTESKPGSCKEGCPPVHVLEIRMLKPSGTTNGGIDDGFVYQGSLADHAANPVVGWIGVFVDTTGDSYRRREVGKNHEVRAEGYGPVYFDVSKDSFEGLKNLYIWSGDMRLSFFVKKTPPASLAKMRLDIPRDFGLVSAITAHPKDNTKVPEGSKKIRFDVMVLNSPVMFMLAEINRNAAGGDIPTTHLGWAARAHEGRVWDYKHPIRRLWGDQMRLGNFSTAVDTGAFSNYHVGYVGAAGGNKLDFMLGLSKTSQKISSRSDDPVEDRFAIEKGFRAYSSGSKLSLYSFGKYLKDYQAAYDALQD